MIARALLGSVLAASAALYCAHAAALDAGVLSGLEARGLVDLDASGGMPPLSDKVDAVTTTPFTRSVVSVADVQPGVFEYASSADVGTLALKVFGTLTNGSGSGIGNIEVPIMRVSAEIRDVITLESTLTTPYDVTLELVVNGNIGVTGGSGNASANALLEFGTNPGVNGFDSGAYSIGPVADTLSVTRTVSGSSVEMDLKAFLGFNVFQVDPGATVTGDLGNTAFLSLILPPSGVELVGSESGTFGVPIPEPGTYALMLAGLVLVGAAARGRARGQGAHG
jgi:hypothetical protein